MQFRYRVVAAFIATIAAASQPLVRTSLFAQARGEQTSPPAGAQGPGGGGRAGGGGFAKNPALPAGAIAAPSTVARTTLQHEWVDIPFDGQRLRTWIEYPTGSSPAPVVLVLSHEAGLDDWMRGVADQLATDGFIAVAPDILSGRGPGGGNFDSFRFAADAIRANAALSEDEVLRRYRTALDYAVKLPRAGGKIGALGVGMGGADAFRLAAIAPNLSAAVIFYGVAPPETVLANVKIPVAGFYGEDDPRVMPTVRTAEAAMKRLGRTYEVHVYPKATQAFMRSTVEGENGAAVAAAWPLAIRFLRQHLN